jgi:hypothetical protein
MSSTFMSLLIVESVLTAAAIVMFLYRGMLDMKEEDQLVLGDSESHLIRDQAVIRQRINWVSRYLKVVGIAWSLLLVAIVGLWIAEGLSLI